MKDKDYYSLFVELSLQQCTKNDYVNKLKVKKHNVTGIGVADDFLFGPLGAGAGEGLILIFG